MTPDQRQLLTWDKLNQTFSTLIWCFPHKTFMYSKLTIKTVEKCVKYVQI